MHTPSRGEADTTPPFNSTMSPVPTARPLPTAPATAALPHAAFARRSVLAAAAALVARPAAAAIGVWDGKSSALGSCPVGAAGDGCRSSLLAADVAKGVKLGGASSGASAPLASGATTAAKLGGPYAAETRALAASMKAYLALAADDPARVPAGRKVKIWGVVGGSSRVDRLVLFFQPPPPTSPLSCVPTARPGCPATRAAAPRAPFRRAGFTLLLMLSAATLRPTGRRLTRPPKCPNWWPTWMMR